MSYFLYLLLSILYVGISFTGLVPYRMKTRYYLLLAIHLLLMYAVLGQFLEQWLTLPLVLISAGIIYCGANRKLWNVILSLVGYFLGVLVNHLFTIPLGLMGISMEDINTKHLLSFLIAVTLTTLFLHMLVRKFFLLPRLSILEDCPLKIQSVFLTELFVGVGLVTINFVYGEASGYPLEVLNFNGVLVLFLVLFTLLMLYYLFQLLHENYELKLLQKEQALMQDYTKKMENFYDEFRVFRHDYKNILSTLRCYIDTKDYSGLEQYFHEKILPASEEISSDNFVIGKLHLIGVPALKSILYSKLIRSLNLGLSLTLELTESLDEVPLDPLPLSRILGILLDNAMEAAVQTEEKYLVITIITADEYVLFSISNSTPSLTVPVTKLYEKGYTTKEQHDGLGLYTVRNMVDSYRHVNFITQYDTVFRQTLEIRRDTDK